MSDDVAAKERTILVAVDEGDESMNALSWCLNNIISADSNDTLLLLYSKPPRYLYGSMDGTGYLFSPEVMASMQKYNNDVASSVLVKAKRLCEQVAPNVRVETRVEDGDPRDVICGVAEKLKPDVLVMGSHGYGPIKRAFLGSVSNHCAQNVNCPVLIVKSPKK
ncbi:PREDICTED: universal stress protein A-like protein [Tarenaya hassleriana]|uniref:universal stress protein A-like protein n=1 Tax=Tarenaya hassleriana TaxID=28532 RepID=UPI00053C8386|nr:PREDICTED: universal stress protein A-like protein [Tarenaya hassleriana]